jgi:4-amino-4-deoxy-L-arabinose transferase-like glycosyltransferase
MILNKTFTFLSLIRNKILFGFILFIYILVGALIYFDITKNKQTSYVKSIWAKGATYIIPLGHELEFGDSDAYNKLAYSILTKGDFYNPAGQKSAWITPGYPLFLAIVYMIFGYKFIPVLIIQALLLEFSLILIFLTTKKIYGQRPALISFIILALNIRFIPYVSQIYTEILFLFFISVCFFATIKLMAKTKLSIFWAIMLGFALGFGFLIRPVLLPAIITIPLFLLVSKIRLKFVFISFATAFFIISLWLARNYIIFNRIVISTSSEISLSDGNLNMNSFNFFEPYSLQKFAEKNTVSFDYEAIVIPDSIKLPLFQGKSELKYPQGYNYELVGNLFAERNSKFKSKKPLQYLIRTTYLLKTMLSPYIIDMSGWNRVISSIFWVLTFLPVYISLFYLKKDPFYWLIFSTSLFMLIIPALNIVDSNLRYQLPSQFLLSIIAGLTIDKLLNKPLTKIFTLNK